MCGATPERARRGESITLEISGLRPGLGVHVNFGAQDLASGATDAAGKATIDFTVPRDATPGRHLLTAGNDGTAFTADCLIEVVDVVACVDDGGCGEDEFCQRERTLCQAGGYCAERPAACPQVSEPVCGCDGKTYDNECAANRRGVSAAHGGPCEAEPETPAADGQRDGFGRWLILLLLIVIAFWLWLWWRRHRQRPAP